MQLFYRQAILEMMWIYQVQSNDPKWLQERNVHVWDKWVADENGDFEFVLNVCEGYVTYNNENSTIVKNVELVDGIYDVIVTIKSNSTQDKNIIKFTSNLVSATGVVAEYNGPLSCSPSYVYKKALD